MTVQSAWRDASAELPPPGVAVVVRTREGRYHEAEWRGDGLGYWRSRDWLGFAVRGYVAWWALLPGELDEQRRSHGTR